MSISSIYSNPINSSLTVPALPATSGDSSSMPFNQVLNESLQNTHYGQAQSSNQGTSSLEKPTLSVMHFMQSSFFGKKIPVTDEQRHIVDSGTVISVAKVESHYEALLQDSRTRTSFPVKMIFEKQPLGTSYKLTDNTEASLKLRADAEQRLDQAVSPLMSSDGGSSYTPLTIPDVPVNNPLAQGEVLDFYNPKTDKMESGSVIIIKGRPYLRDEGVPLSLRAERL